MTKKRNNPAGTKQKKRGFVIGKIMFWY